VSEFHYDWKDGPAEIQQHSVAKHNILQSYLAAYFQTLVSSPNQEVFRLTLVDAFAGGGMYVHKDSGELVKGSPLIFLNATREAEFLINKDRRNPIRFEIDYFFIEADRSACSHLEKILRDEGHGGQIGNAIQLRNARFQDEADSIVEFIKKKSPRNGRSIFSLDQYGYSEVPTALIRKIFSNLPSAEVILTFAVDSLLNYAQDGKLTQNLLDSIGVSDVLRGCSLEELKKDKNWRLLIQSSLYQSLVTKSGARHYTPFFIRNKKGHGDYWLIHLSQHHRARDVMTEVHWRNNNHFIHYGGAGLDMFQMIGYEPTKDAVFTGQSGLGFEFDDVARKASIRALSEQVPHRVYASDEGISFGELFVSTCNDSPASARIYRDAIGHLVEQEVVEVISISGTKRRSALAIEDSDQIKAPRQRRLFLT
jgi:three-Cys-motif partner protein